MPLHGLWRDREQPVPALAKGLDDVEAEDLSGINIACCALKRGRRRDEVALNARSSVYRPGALGSILCWRRWVLPSPMARDGRQCQHGPRRDGDDRRLRHGAVRHLARGQYLRRHHLLAFIVTALIGLAIERIIVRRRYGRLLDTLAGETWGVAILNPAGGATGTGPYVLRHSAYRGPRPGTSECQCSAPSCREPACWGEPRSTGIARSSFW